MNLIILQMNVIITLFCTTWTILRMRSRNNEIEIQEKNLVRALDQKPEYHLEWPYSTDLLL